MTRHLLIGLSTVAVTVVGLLAEPATVQESTTARIMQNSEVVTMINVVTPTTGTQDEVAALLSRGMRETMSRLPGFISATVHKSEDNNYVVVYAQWTSLEAVQNAGAQIEAGNAPAMAAAFARAKPEFHPYEIVSVTTAAEAQR